ncbi:MAG: DUF4397 domain-containing protein, partial [Haloarculaceae archaeon]
MLLVLALVGSAAIGGVVVATQPPAQQQTAQQAPTQASQDTAYLRLVHAAPGLAMVDISLDGQQVASGVDYGAVSGYQAVPAGTYNVTVTAAGTDIVLLEDSLTIDPGTAVTVAATGGTGTTDAQLNVYEDDALEPGEGQAAVRVLHLSPDAGAVDVVAVGSGQPATATATAAGTETTAGTATGTAAGTATGTAAGTATGTAAGT